MYLLQNWSDNLQHVNSAVLKYPLMRTWGIRFYTALTKWTVTINYWIETLDKTTCIKRFVGTRDCKMS